MGGVIVGWSQGRRPLELPVHLESVKIPLMDAWAGPMASSNCSNLHVSQLQWPRPQIYDDSCSKSDNIDFRIYRLNVFVFFYEQFLPRETL